MSPVESVRFGEVAIFLSYSRENNSAADELESALSALGAKVWRDQNDIYAGSMWPKIIGEAVAGSDALVLLWSAQASASESVELEWCTALALKKPVIPILLDPTRLPKALLSFHAIGADRLSDRLADALRNVTSRPAHSDSVATRKVLDVMRQGDSDFQRLIAELRRLTKDRNDGLVRVVVRIGWLLLAATLLAVLAPQALRLSDPFHIDTRTIASALVLAIPAAILAISAALLKWKYARISLLTAATLWVPAYFFFLPNLFVGPVSGVSSPSVVVLFYSDKPTDPESRATWQAIQNLPPSFSYGGFTIGIQAFEYDSDPSAPRVENAIQANPYIRGVVKVVQGAQDKIHVRSEIPFLKKWREIGVPAVRVSSEFQDDVGYKSDFKFVMGPTVGLNLHFGLPISQMDYRFEGINVGIGPVGGVQELFYTGLEPRSTLPENIGNRDFVTGASGVREKLLATVLATYADFTIVGLGSVSPDCDALRPIGAASGSDGMTWLQAYGYRCLDHQERQRAYATGHLTEIDRKLMTERIAQAILLGAPLDSWVIAVESASGLPWMRSLRTIVERCGTFGDVESAYHDFKNLRMASPRAAEYAACIFERLGSAEAGSYDNRELKEIILPLIALFRAMDLTPDPRALLERNGISEADYCAAELALYSESLLSDGPARLDDLKRSECFLKEPVPRWTHLFAHLKEGGYRQLEAGVEAFVANRKIDDQVRKEIKDLAMDVFAEKDRSVRIVAQVDLIVDAFNRSKTLCGDPTRHVVIESPSATALVEILCSDAGSGAERIDRLLDQLATIPVLQKQIFVFESIRELMDALERQSEDWQATGKDISATDPGKGASTLFYYHLGGKVLQQTEVAWGKGFSAWVDSVKNRVSPRSLRRAKVRAQRVFKYYPELQDLPTAAAALLSDLPKTISRQSWPRTMKEIDFLAANLRGDDYYLVSGLLGEAYLESGNAERAKDVFETIARETKSPVRRDYYALRASDLDERFCMKVGGHRIASAELSQLERIRKALGDRTRYTIASPAWYLWMLSQLPRIQDLDDEERGQFAAFAKQIYGSANSEEIEALGKDVPGGVLRTIEADYFANRDTAFRAALIEQLHANKNGIIVWSALPQCAKEVLNEEEYRASAAPHAFCEPSLCINVAMSLAGVGDKEVDAASRALATELADAACSKKEPDGCVLKGMYYRSGAFGSAKAEEAVGLFEKRMQRRKCAGMRVGGRDTGGRGRYREGGGALQERVRSGLRPELYAGRIRRVRAGRGGQR